MSRATDLTARSGRPGAGELVAFEHVPAVVCLDPVGVVDRVEVALAEVRRDRDRGQLTTARVPLLEPGDRAGDHGAGRAAKQEAAPREAVAGADRVRFLD